jgi:elongator complex protein 1
MANLTKVSMSSNGFKEVVYGLSGNGRLYADGKIIATNCTSFVITSAHLIFTTTQHIVKFVHLCEDDEGKPIN